VLCLDTNALIFATVADSPKRDSTLRAMAVGRESGDLAVTPQILREYVAVTTHPRFLPKPLEHAVALDDVATFRENFLLLSETPDTFDLFLSLVRRHRIVGRAVHDANIAATMPANGVTRILTDNGADFRRFAPEIEIVGLA
jgi:predicted nucleic acid-binding protein